MDLDERFQGSKVPEASGYMCDPHLVWVHLV